MKNNYYQNDTIQIKRMKKYALLWFHNSSGEIYKLLNLEILHKLSSKIENGTINLKSKVLYGKTKITYEENFISILDKYINYVKDTYRIKTNELLFIIEQTLKNNYNKTLYIRVDFHDIPFAFINDFKKLFIANVVYNTRYYAKQDVNKDYVFLQRANKFLEKKILNNDNDLKVIEKFIIKVINARKSNLYNIFIPHGEINKKQISYYLQQVNWIYEDYYLKNSKS